MNHLELGRILLERMGDFVFFHLGVDAKVELREEDPGIHFRIQHERVQSFDFELTWVQVEQMTTDPELLEDYLLEHLARYRR